MTKRILKIAAVYIVALSMLMVTACPPKDAVRNAIDASYRLPGATNDIIKAVREARDKGLITVDQGRQFGEPLNDLAKAEVIFVGMVKALNAAVKANGTADAAEVAKVRDFFDASVIEPFLRVLQVARVLSGDSIDLILVGITATRLLLRTIGLGLGSRSQNALR